MNAKLFLLPALALGGVAFLLAPLPTSRAFSKIGGSLGTGQRDVRLRDNFTDTTANNNTTPSTQFPFYVGAELAIWKGIVEWGSGLHGNGAGDPQQAQLGNGGANFDALFAGNAAGPGNTNHNIVSGIASCSGGVLAYTETPISDGWRIRFCESWVWDDGPGTISNRWDIQGIMAHEYGHALGLGHSGVSGTTMWPSVSAGSTAIRSIEADDIAGIQCIYGVKSATKPTITSTTSNPGDGTITIVGSNFSPTGNEVWFASEAVTAASVDPRVIVSNVSSNGTTITVTVPAAAGPGDVIVKKAGTGHATVSNAFPIFGSPPIVVQPSLTGVIPAAIEALIPGTARSVALAGTALDRTVDVLLDGSAIERSRWTIVDATTLRLDMPQADLGPHELGVTDGLSTSVVAIEVLVSATPRLELGSGDPRNVVHAADGLVLRLAGTPGSLHFVLASPDLVPSQNPWASLSIGNGFSSLFHVGSSRIPDQGWLETAIPMLPDPGVLGTIWYAQSLALETARPLPASNLQSILLVR